MAGCGCSGPDCECEPAAPAWIKRAGERNWIALPRRRYDPSLSGPPELPGACGESYAASLFVASGGRTIEDPYDKPWCGETDAEAWKAQADHVFSLVRAGWNALMGLANERRDWSETQALDASVTAYETEHGALPEPSFWMAFGAGGCGEAVATMHANIRTGACVLERLNAAIGRLGGAAIDVPYQEQPTDGGLLGVLGPGIVVAGLVALFFLSRR